jgi:hypothetical protein
VGVLPRVGVVCVGFPTQADAGSLGLWKAGACGQEVQVATGVWCPQAWHPSVVAQGHMQCSQAN